jgi:hypothetical protein
MSVLARSAGHKLALGRHVMQPNEYDLVVIGSGPAGQKGAICAAKLRKKVAVIDRERTIGGVCVHTGTIPSKMFREAVLYLSGLRQRTFYGRGYALKDRIEMADLVLPQLARVGYVRGASDQVPEALEAVGIPLKLLTPDDLERGDLSHYDAIVVGSRAYETDPALVASNGRLLDYARAGGRLIVQYQEYPYVRGGYAPFPFTIAQPHDRVTDETAPVELIQPVSRLFLAPNAIRSGDWDGWVQERGLYFAHTWDQAYRPVLQTGDAGEKLQGGLLVARLGQGLFVYTGLSFFRQLPAGVPGAYRLFANLLALRPDDVR